MLEIFNNKWIIIISFILLYIIIKKFLNFFKPININDYNIEEINKKKIKKQLSFKNLNINISDVVSYYFGIL